MFAIENNEIELTGDLFKGDERILTGFISAACGRNKGLLKSLFNFVFANDDIRVFSVVAENSSKNKMTDKKNCIPDFKFYTSNGLYFLESKIYDRNYHLEEYLNMNDYIEGHLGYILTSLDGTTQLVKSPCPVKLWQDYAKSIAQTYPQISAFILGVIDKIPIDKVILDKKIASLRQNLFRSIKPPYTYGCYKEEDNTYGYYIFTNVSNEYWIGYVPSCSSDGFLLCIMVANNMAEAIESQEKDYQHLTPLGRFNSAWHYYEIKETCDENSGYIENAVGELHNKFVKTQEEQINKK